jgi:hypothetical protein
LELLADELFPDELFADELLGLELLPLELFALERFAVDRFAEDPFAEEPARPFERLELLDFRFPFDELPLLRARCFFTLPSSIRPRQPDSSSSASST